MALASLTHFSAAYSCRCINNAIEESSLNINKNSLNSRLKVKVEICICLLLKY